MMIFNIVLYENENLFTSFKLFSSFLGHFCFFEPTIENTSLKTRTFMASADFGACIQDDVERYLTYQMKYFYRISQSSYELSSPLEPEKIITLSECIFIKSEYANNFFVSHHYHYED